MKNLIVSLMALAIFATDLNAQSNRQVDEAIKTIRGSKNKYNGPSMASLSEGVLGQNGKLSISTNATGQVVISNPTNAYTFTLDLPTPTANRTISWPIGGGTLVATPTTLSWEFTGETYNTTLVATEPTVGDATITIPDLADVDQALMLSSLTTNAKDAANSITFASNAILFECATADGFEITVSPADATADATLTIPNFGVNGAFVLSTLTTNTPQAANSIWLASNSIVGEGTTADTSETTISFGEPTADRTITLPDASGTVRVAQASTAVSLTADNQAVTPGVNTIIQLSSDDATATNRTFTLSATGATTGAIYVLIGPATNQCEIADTGIQVLSATWSPTTGDSLTLLFDGTSFIELARSNN